LSWGQYKASKRDRINWIFGGFDEDILEAFFKINSDQLARLISHYKGRYGDSAGIYARKTYPKWKSGEVNPSGQTVERLLESLPLVLDLRVKCDLLRKLRERHRKKDNVSLKCDTTNWREVIQPIAENIIQKARSADLPEIVKSHLSWLSQGDMQAAQKLLEESEVQEGKIAISLLHQEFANIENLLVSLTQVRKKISHTIALPYGNINITIKRGKKQMAENEEPSSGRSLFKPRAGDILDNALENLDQTQVRQISQEAVREAIRVEVERKMAGIKVEQAQQDMEIFIQTADRMERRGHDYKMSANYQTASGTTSIEVSKKISTTIIVVAVALAIVALLIYFGRN
jgi:hypothetical protein